MMELQKTAADELTDAPALQNGGRGDMKAWRRGGGQRDGGFSVMGG